jgi:hypothetical protein
MLWITKKIYNVFFINKLVERKLNVIATTKANLHFSFRIIRKGPFFTFWAFFQI